MTQPLATYEFSAPACWASTLLNGDDSGLQFNELIAMREHFRGSLPHVIDCSALPRIGRFNGIPTHLLTYTAYVHIPPKRLT